MNRSQSEDTLLVCKEVELMNPFFELIHTYVRAKKNIVSVHLFSNNKNNINV